MTDLIMDDDGDHLPVIEASFEGRCPWCDEHIYEGDLITRDDDGFWTHWECT